MAIIDVYSSQALVNAMKAAEEANDKQFSGKPYFLEISSQEVVSKKAKLMMKPNSIRKVFAQVLEIDHRCVELTLCLGVPEGIQLGFNLYTADRKRIGRFDRLLTIFNSITTTTKASKVA